MKKILLIGIFLSKNSKAKISITPAMQLADMLAKENYNLIKTSNYTNRFLRLITTSYTICNKHKQYQIAIVPFYGGFRSFVWEYINIKLLKLLKKKVVLIIHGGGIPTRMDKYPKKYLSLIQKASIVICPSKYLASVLQNKGVKSHVVENAINLNDYTFTPKQKLNPKLFWMRNFEIAYNPFMAIKVLQQLKKIYPTATLVMAGHDGGLLQKTKSLAQNLGLTDSISFPGYINNEQKKYFANDCDFFICTNIIDNAPIALVEMMLLGVPIVTVNTGGIPFIVTNNVNGVLTNFDDEVDMANAINELITNPSKAIAITNNAYQYAQIYSEENVIEKWKNIFNNLGYNNN